MRYLGGHPRPVCLAGLTPPQLGIPDLLATLVFDRNGEDNPHLIPALARTARGVGIKIITTLSNRMQIAL
jgi:hypothetical protein